MSSYKFGTLRILRWLAAADTIALTRLVAFAPWILAALAALSGLVCWGVAHARGVDSLVAGAWAVALSAGLFFLLWAARRALQRALAQIALDTGTKPLTTLSVAAARQWAQDCLDHAIRRGELEAGTTLNGVPKVVGRADAPALKPRFALGLGLLAQMAFLASLAAGWALRTEGQKSAGPRTTTPPGWQVERSSTPPAEAPDVGIVSLPAPEPPTVPAAPGLNAIPHVDPLKLQKITAQPVATPTPLTAAQEESIRALLRSQTFVGSAPDLPGALKKLKEPALTTRANLLRDWDRLEETPGQVALETESSRRWRARWTNPYKAESAAGRWEKGDLEMTATLTPQGNGFVMRDFQAQPKGVERGWQATPEVIAHCGTVARGLVAARSTGSTEKLSMYLAPTITFFDRGTITQQKAVQLDREELAQWPNRHVEMTSPIDVRSLDDGRWQVSFAQLSASGKPQGDRRTVISQVALVIAPKNGQWPITSLTETGKITEVTPAPAPPVPAPPAPVAEPAPAPVDTPPPIIAAAPPSTPSLYSVPQLESLVGVTLDNQWLYGDFAMVGYSDNTASFHTWGHGILFSATGPTRLSVECDGISLSRFAAWRLRRGMQPVFTFSRRNPLELISVKRVRGIIEVRARYHGILDGKLEY